MRTIRDVIGFYLVQLGVKIMTDEKLFSTIKCFARAEQRINPYRAMVEIEPGRTELHLTRQGKVVSIVTLSSFTNSLSGVDATFVDQAKFMERRPVFDTGDL